MRQKLKKKIYKNVFKIRNVSSNAIRSVFLGLIVYIPTFIDTERFIFIVEVVKFSKHKQTPTK